MSQPPPQQQPWLSMPQPLSQATTQQQHHQPAAYSSPQVQVVPPPGTPQQPPQPQSGTQQLTQAQLSPAPGIAATVPVPSAATTPSPSNNNNSNSMTSSFGKLFGGGTSGNNNRNVGFAVTPALASQHEKHRTAALSDSPTQAQDGEQTPTQRIRSAGGAASSSSAILFQCWVTKLRSWRTGYARLWVLTAGYDLVTLDPHVEHVPETNRWSLRHVRVTPDADSDDCLYLHLLETKERLKFQCDSAPRAVVLQHVLELQQQLLLPGGNHQGNANNIAQALQQALTVGMGTLSGGGGALFRAQRWTRRGTVQPVLLQLSSSVSLVERQATPPHAVLQTYRLTPTLLHGVSLAVGHAHVLHVHLAAGSNGRKKIRQWELIPHTPQASPRSQLVALLQESMVNQLGVALPMEASLSMDTWLQQKQAPPPPSVGTILTTWPVRKTTARHGGQAIARHLCLTSHGDLLERDDEGFYVSTRSLVTDLVAIVRPHSAGDEVVLEFTHGMQRLYQSTQRDALIVSLLDTAAAAAASSNGSGVTNNANVILVDHALAGYALSWRGSSILQDDQRQPPAKKELSGNSTVVIHCLRRLYALSTQAYAYICSNVGTDLQALAGSNRTDAAAAARRGDVVAETGTLLRACREFQASVTPSQLSSLFSVGTGGTGATVDAQHKKWVNGTIGALSGLVAQLLVQQQQQQEESLVATTTATTFLQTLARLVATPTAGYKSTVELDTFHELLPLLVDSRRQWSALGSYWAFSVVQALVSAVHPLRDAEQEFVNKSVIFHTAADGTNRLQAMVVDGLMSSLLNTSGNGTTTTKTNELTLMVVSDILQSVLCSQHDTTPPVVFKVLLQALSRRYRALLDVLQQSTTSSTTTTATPFVLENVALLLHLVSTHDNVTAGHIREAALSSGLVLQHFYYAVFSPAEGQRFLSRFLCSLWLSGTSTAVTKRLLQRLVPPGFLPYLSMPGLSKAEQEQLDAMERDTYRDSQATAGAGADAASGTNATRLRARIRQSAAAAATQQQQQDQDKKTPQRLENFRIFFHVLTQDHALADLIWSEQTRLELRTALELELQRVQRETEARAPQPVAWNHAQFRVTYPSLQDEIQVGRVYMRLWLAAGDSFIQSYGQDPNNDVVQLWQTLFRRFLCEWHGGSPHVTHMCLQCLERLYALHGATQIQSQVSSDMGILVQCLATAQAAETQYCLLQLVATMLGVGAAERLRNSSSKSAAEDASTLAFADNAEPLLQPESIGQLCQLVAWGHAASRGRTLRAHPVTTQLLKNGGESDDPSAAAAAAAESLADNESAIPVADDADCPAVWYTASTSRIPPPAETIRGPFRVSQLAKLLDQGELSPYDLVAASSVVQQDADADTVQDHQVDTGQWKRLKERWQLRWKLLLHSSSSDSNKTAASPSRVSVLALKCLTRLVDLHPSLDAAGVPFVPIPTAKRLLCSSNAVGNGSDVHPLAMVCQALLCHQNAQVVEESAILLTKLLQHNPMAMSKFYLTGAFYFMLSYQGSNFRALAHLLHATHLKQQHYGLAQDGDDATAVSERSILGPLLPQGLIQALDNYGPDRFAAIFLQTADTPEVIWNAAMRRHLQDEIRQHLADFPQRLVQNHGLVYEYCPMPFISYQSLSSSRPGLLFCHNYYLANLCDEEKFPDWPIAEPVHVLKACLRQFHLQGTLEDNHGGESDGPEEVSLQEAQHLLHLQEGVYGIKELRRAYRLQARLYHPDKNPTAEGREMFQAIQRAYQVLLPVLERDERRATGTSGEEPTSSAAAEGFAGGLERMCILHLLIRAQLLLYRRFEQELANLTYPAYKILLQCLVLPASSLEMANARNYENGLLASGGSCIVCKERAELIQHGVELVYRTCLVSPRNAAQLYEQQGAVGLPVLAQLMRVATRTLEALSDRGEMAALSRISFLTTIQHIVRTLAGVAFYPSGRDCILELDNQEETHENISELLADWKLCINGTVVAHAGGTADADGNLVVNHAVRLYALQGLAYFSKHKVLQNLCIQSGMIWPLLRLLLSYDPTADAPNHGGDDDSLESSVYSRNRLAHAAVRALGALAGVVVDFEKNPALIQALGNLLTEPIAKLLRNHRTEEILRILNSNQGAVEEPHLIWNVEMKRELLDFLDHAESADTAEDGSLSGVKEALSIASSFQFKALQDEFTVGGVYVRVFVSRGKDAWTKIDDAAAFAGSLIRYVARSWNAHQQSSALKIAVPNENTDDDPAEARSELGSLQFAMAVKALWFLIKLQQQSTAGSDDFLGMLFGEMKLFASAALAFLDLPHEATDAFVTASDMLSIVSSNRPFANVVAETGELWRVMRLLERPDDHDEKTTALDSQGTRATEVSGQNDQRRERAWSVLEALSSSPHVATQLVTSAGWLELLGIFVGYSCFTKAWASRLGAARTLSRMLWDQSTSAVACPLMQRFLPPTLVGMLKEDPEGMLKRYDDEADNPELIWDSIMRAELRTVVANQLDLLCFSEAGTESHPVVYTDNFALPPDFRVNYASLHGELFLGGVYVSRYLKDPTYSLRDASTFLEALLQAWMRELQRHIDGGDQATAPETDVLGTAAGTPDVLQSVTTAVVLVTKAKELVCDKLAEWGYVTRAIAALDRVLKRDMLGTPLVMTVRVLHAAVSRKANVESVATSGVAFVDLMIGAIGRETLHPESALMVETLLRTFEVALGDLNNTTEKSVYGLGNGVAMAPSPAPSNQSVTQQIRNRYNALADNVSLASAPSPAPGDGPVRSNRERVNLGDDPLAMMFGDGPPLQPTPPAPSAAPAQTIAQPVIGHSPTPMPPPMIFGTVHPQPAAPPTGSTQNFVESIVAHSATPPPVSQGYAQPLLQQRPFMPNPQANGAQPHLRGHQNAGWNQDNVMQGHAPQQPPPSAGMAQHTSGGTHRAGGSVHSSHHLTAVQPYHPPQTLANGPNVHHTTSRTSENAARPLAQPPTANMDVSASIPRMNGNGAQSTPAAQTSQDEQSWPRADLDDSASDNQTPHEQYFQSAPSLSANSLNRPPSTVLHTLQEVHSAEANNLEADDDDSADSSPPMTLFGTNPLPQDPAGSPMFEHDTQPSQLHRLDQPQTQGVHEAAQPQEGYGYRASSVGAVDEQHRSSSRPYHRGSPTMEPAGIDARSPLDALETASEQAASTQGARGAVQGRASLLEQALACNLCEFLVTGFLEHPKLTRIMDPAAGKVHAIALLKLLCDDPGYGRKFALILDELPAWRKYKFQDHSLLITSSTQDKEKHNLLANGDGSGQRLLTGG